MVAVSPEAKSPTVPLMAAGPHADPHVTIGCDVLLEVSATLG